MSKQNEASAPQGALPPEEYFDQAAKRGGKARAARSPEEQAAYEQALAVQFAREVLGSKPS